MKYRDMTLVATIMRPILPAVLLMVIGCSAPMAGPQTSAAAEVESAVTLKTLAVREGQVELAGQPVTVGIPLGDARSTVREVARDPNRSLILRVENIAATGQPDLVYEVLIGDDPQPAGVLALYGLGDNNGSYVATLPVDEAMTRASGDGDGELRVTFRPAPGTDANGRNARIESKTRIRFSRLRLTEE